MSIRPMGAKTFSLWVTETPTTVLVGSVFFSRTIRLENIGGHDFSLFSLGRSYHIYIFSEFVILLFHFILGKWLKPNLPIILQPNLRLIPPRRRTKLGAASHGLALEMFGVCFMDDRLLILKVSLLRRNTLIDTYWEVFKTLNTRTISGHQLILQITVWNVLEWLIYLGCNTRRRLNSLQRLLTLCIGFHYLLLDEGVD